MARSEAMASSSSASRFVVGKIGLLRCSGRRQADEEEHVRLDRAALGQRPQDAQRLLEPAGPDQRLGFRHIGCAGHG